MRVERRGKRGWQSCVWSFACLVRFAQDKREAAHDLIPERPI